MNTYQFTDDDYAVVVKVQIGNHEQKAEDLIAYAKATFGKELTLVQHERKEVDLHFVDEDYAEWAHKHLLTDWLPAATTKAQADYDLYKLQMKLTGKKSTSALIPSKVLGRMREMTGIKVEELFSF